MTLAFTPGDTTVLVSRLVDLYDDAESHLLALIAERVEKGLDEPAWARRQVMELQRTRHAAKELLDKLARDGDHAIFEVVAGSGNRGATTAIAQMARVAPGGIVGTPVDLDRMSVFTAELTGITRNTNAHILRSVDDIYRRVIADVTARELLGAATRRELAETALQRLARSGITGFVDKAGRRWEAASYVEMAGRAATMNASLEGHAQQLLARGHALVVVSDVPQECALCRPFEGQVLSLHPGVTASVAEDGKRIVGTLASAREAGLFHPGCRHSIAPYQPGLTASFGETADPAGDEARRKLRYLERQTRAAKREELTALTPDGKKAAKAKVRAYQAKIREHVAATSAKRQPGRERIGAAR